MKKIYFLTTLFLLTNINLIAQTIDVITELSNPNAIEIDGNNLYIAEFEGNKISKINITDSSPVAVDIVTNLNGPSGIILIGNYLYISELNGNKISKIDITNNSSTVIDVITELNRPHKYY